MGISVFKLHKGLYSTIRTYNTRIEMTQRINTKPTIFLRKESPVKVTCRHPWCAYISMQRY